MRIDVEPRRALSLPFVVAWLVLLVLGGVSLLTAFLGMGSWGPVAQFAIAALQAAIVFILFMRLKGPPSLKWVFAFTGFFWLMFLFGLSMTVYGVRKGWPPSYMPTRPGITTLNDGR
jgi:caa(3)-type oxidase subunit IV